MMEARRITGYRAGRTTGSSTTPPREDGPRVAECKEMLTQCKPRQRTVPCLVGHARLYIQDENGKWYVTEFTGNIDDKSSARIYINEADMDEVNAMLGGETLSGVCYIHIKGDFSKGYEKAREYDQSNHGGYNLIANNCLHYNREILMQGAFEYGYEKMIVQCSITRVPVLFYLDLKQGRAAYFMAKAAEVAQ